MKIDAHRNHPPDEYDSQYLVTGSFEKPVHPDQRADHSEGDPNESFEVAQYIAGVPLCFLIGAHVCLVRRKTDRPPPVRPFELQN